MLFIYALLSSQVWSIPQAPLTKLMSIIHLKLVICKAGFIVLCEEEWRKRGVGKMKENQEERKKRKDELGKLVNLGFNNRNVR